MRVAPLLAFVAAASVLVTRAEAADKYRVVIVPSDRDARLVRLVDAELSADGFDVTTKVSPPAKGSVDLETIAHDAEARAIVTIDAKKRAAVVYLARVAEDPIEVARFDAIGTTEDDGRIAAVHVAEALRAASIEEEAKEEPPPVAETKPAVVAIAATDHPPPIADAPPPIASPTPSSHRHLTFGLGPAVYGSPGGLSPFFDLELRAALTFAPHWSIDARYALPISTNTVVNPEGASYGRLSVLSGALEGAYELAPDLLGEVAVGAGDARVSFDGHGNYPNLSSDDARFIPLVFARFGASREIVPDLSLRIDLLLGSTLGRATLIFANEQVATWGRPLVAGTITVSYALF